jgi:allantoicase
VQALQVVGSLRVDPAAAGRLVAARPLSGELPSVVARLVEGTAYR